MTIRSMWKKFLGWFVRKVELKPVEPPKPKQEFRPTFNSDEELLRIRRSAVRVGRKPEVQELSATFADGSFVRFSCLHVRDIWGSEGSRGSAEIKRAGEGASGWFNANLLLRWGVLDNPTVKAIAYDPTKLGPPELPECVAGRVWERWQTADGKGMYNSEGVDLYALRALVGLAKSQLAIDSQIVSVTGQVQSWQ